MKTLDELFKEEEDAKREQARREIAEERARYEADPVYRAAVDAKREKLLADMEAGTSEEEEEDEDVDQDS